MDPMRLPPGVASLMMNKHDKEHAKFDNNESLKQLMKLKTQELGLRGEDFGIHKNDLFPMYDYGLYRNIQYLDKRGESVNDLYKLNRYGFRSEEFSSSHEGKHILFAGCSVTFGDSMYLNKTWPMLVYSEIAKTSKTSGYFNIGALGASIGHVDSLIKEYIGRYGEPNHLFVLLPDLGRDNGEGVSPLKSTLESLTKTQIYTSSWDQDLMSDISGSNHDIRNSLPGLVKFKRNDLLRHVYGFAKNNPDEDLALKAMDDSHPGVAEHLFYAKLFLHAYRNRKG